MNKKEKIEIANKTAKVAGLFCLIISFLLILNYWQMHRSDPLESRTLETLVERLSLESGNQELIEEIRQLDLLTRRAYFTSIWQVRTGGYLLLAAAILLLVSLRIHSSLTSRISKPENEEEDPLAERSLSRKWILAGTLVFVLLALAASFTVPDPLERYMAGPETVPSGDPIERISLTDAAPAVSPEPLAAEEPSRAGDYNDAAGEELSQPAHARQPAEKAPETVVFPTEAELMENHNAFRGPWGHGVVHHRNIPVEWDGVSGRNIRWKVPVPLHAYSSPVIWGDRLFITGADESRRVVFCYDRHTGNLLWERDAGNIPGSPATPPRTTEDTGLGAPTVTTDGIGVYAIFGTGDIIGLDLEGNLLWARNLGVPDNHYGHSSSLLSHDEKLFVQYDDRNRGRIICLSVLTGETIWDITRDSDISWASPILARIDGTMQLVVIGNPIVAGYDIQTGMEMWSVSAMSGEVGPSPGFGGGMVYAANEYATMVAIDPASGTIVWEDNYYLPEVSSPAYSEGLLFISTTYALIACFDAKTGEFLWEYDTEDIFYSSPIVAGGNVYITDTGGITYVFAVAREPELIAANPLGAQVYTIPAFAENRIYIRGETHLYCIGN